MRVHYSITRMQCISTAIILKLPKSYLGSCPKSIYSDILKCNYMYKNIIILGKYVLRPIKYGSNKNNIKGYKYLDGQFMSLMDLPIIMYKEGIIINQLVKQ